MSETKPTFRRYEDGAAINRVLQNVAPLMNVDPSVMDAFDSDAIVRILAEVNALARQGKDIVSFCIGQPDFPAPEHVQEAAIRAIRERSANAKLPVFAVIDNDVTDRGVRARFIGVWSSANSWPAKSVV